MKLLKIQALQTGFLILFIILSVCVWNRNDTEKQAGYYKSFDHDWSNISDGEAYFWKTLPEWIDTRGTGQVVLEKTLDGEIDNADYLGFYTSHLLLEIYVEDELIYELLPSKSENSKTPGNIWNFVNLHHTYEGKQIRIIMKSAYRQEEMRLPDFYFGTRDSMIMRHMQENLFPFLLSIVMLFIGILLVCVWIIVGKKLLLNEGIPWLGALSIMLAVWSSMECQVLPLFYGRPLLFSQLTFLSLKLIPLPMLQFIGIIYDARKDKILWGLSIASCVDFWGTTILQMGGVLDFQETLFVTHAICIISVVYFFTLTIKVMKAQGTSAAGSSKTVAVHALCIGVVAFTVALDIISYYKYHNMDSARFCRIGILIYIVVLAFLLLDDSIRLIRAGQQAKRLQKEAETDALTKLKNRLSFEKDLHQIPNEKFKQYGVIVCDLNNLKKFNDSYGHSMGDYYIIICSEIIQDIFGRFGAVYRIGGDEFCGILERLEETKAEELTEEMNQRIHSLNSQQFEVSMEIALGYAGFDPEMDQNLSDTMKRADEIMYKNKNGMKA